MVCRILSAAGKPPLRSSAHSDFFFPALPAAGGLSGHGRASARLAHASYCADISLTRSGNLVARSCCSARSAAMAKSSQPSVCLETNFHWPMRIARLPSCSQKPGWARATDSPANAGRRSSTAMKRMFGFDELTADGRSAACARVVAKRQVRKRARSVMVQAWIGNEGSRIDAFYGAFFFTGCFLPAAAPGRAI